MFKSICRETEEALRLWNQAPPIEGAKLEVFPEEDGLYFRVRFGDQFLSHWNLYPMPFCCGALVSGWVEIFPPYQRKGYGRLLNNWRQKLAKHLGFGLLLCTDVQGNIPQTHILNREGWRMMGAFTNPRTGNVVEVRGKELRDV